MEHSHIGYVNRTLRKQENTSFLLVSQLKSEHVVSDYKLYGTGHLRGLFIIGELKQAILGV